MDAPGGPGGGPGGPAAAPGAPVLVQGCVVYSQFLENSKSARSSRPDELQTRGEKILYKSTMPDQLEWVPGL